MLYGDKVEVSQYQNGDGVTIIYFLCVAERACGCHHRGRRVVVVLLSSLHETKEQIDDDATTPRADGTIDRRHSSVVCSLSKKG